MSRIPHRLAAGFTMIELIVALLLLGLLSAVALSSMGDGGDRTLPYEFTTLKTHIRYAQAQAMGLNAEYGIRCQGGAYWLFSGTATTNVVRLPGQDADTVRLASAVNPGSFTIAFNGRGQPFSAAALTNANRLATAMTVRLSEGGESRSFSITVETGYIP